MQWSWQGSVDLGHRDWRLLVLKLLLIAVVVGSIITAAAILLMVLTAAALVLGTGLLGYYALRWALGRRNCPATQSTASLYEIAQAPDSREAYALAIAALYRLCDEALGIDLMTHRQDRRQALERIAREAKALTSLVQAIAKSARREAGAEVQAQAFWELAKVAQTVSGYAEQGAKLRVIGPTQLWYLERQRAALAAQRDHLMTELIGWERRVVRPLVFSSTEPV